MSASSADAWRPLRRSWQPHDLQLKDALPLALEFTTVVQTAFEDVKSIAANSKIWRIEQFNDVQCHAMFSVDSQLFVYEQHSKQELLFAEALNATKIRCCDITMLHTSFVYLVAYETNVIQVFRSDAVSSRPVLVCTYHADAQQGRVLAGHWQRTDVLHLLQENVLYFWVVLERTIEFVCLTFTAIGHDQQAQRLLQLDGADRLGQFIRMEVLSSPYGPSTFVALHYSTISNAQTADDQRTACCNVVPIDARLVLRYAEKIRRKESSRAIDDCACTLPPPVRVPLALRRHPAEDTSNAYNLGILFSNIVSRSPKRAEQRDRAVSAIVVSGSVRTWGGDAGYGKSLQTALLRDSFSFEVLVVSSRGVVLHASYETSERLVVREVFKQGVDAFSRNLHTPLDLTPTLAISDYSVSSNNSIVRGDEGLLVVKNPRELPLASSASGASRHSASAVSVAVGVQALWKASVLLQLMAPVRVRAVQSLAAALLDSSHSSARLHHPHHRDAWDQPLGTGNADFVGRLALLEMLVAGGHSSLIAEYITTTNDGSKTMFVLSDVGWLFDWAASESVQHGDLRSVLSHVELLALDLAERVLVPTLLLRKSAVASLMRLHDAHFGNDAGLKLPFHSIDHATDSDCGVDQSVELQSHLALCHGLQCVLDALLQRKRHHQQRDNARTNRAAAVAGDETTSAQLIHAAETDLLLLTMRVQALTGALLLLHRLLITPALSLQCFVPLDACSSLHEAVHAQSLQPTALVASLLPSFMVGECIYHQLLQRVNYYFPSLQVTSIHDACHPPGAAASEVFATINARVCQHLFLPFLCMRECCAGRFISAPVAGDALRASVGAGWNEFDSTEEAVASQTLLQCVTSKTNVAGSLTLHVLLQAFRLSNDATVLLPFVDEQRLHWFNQQQSTKNFTSSVASTHLHRQISQLTASWSQCLQLDPATAALTTAFWRVDANFALHDAANTFCVPQLQHLVDDTAVVQCVIQLLTLRAAHDNVASARRILLHFVSVVTTDGCSTMRLDKAVLPMLSIALLVLVQRPESWQIAWQDAKHVSVLLAHRAFAPPSQQQQVPSEADALTRELTRLLCRWAWQARQFGAVLQTPFSDTELEEVHAFLRHLAEQQILSADFDTCAVDLCCAFFIRGGDIAAAEQLHLAQIEALQQHAQQSSQQQRFQELMTSQIAVRQTLLDARRTLPAGNRLNFHVHCL